MSGTLGEIVELPDSVALARAVAERFASLAREAIDRRGRFDVALAGGSTPKAAYAVLAARGPDVTVPWEHVRFFFSDERCVGPSDEQSNYKMAAGALLEPLGIVPAHVFRMRGEDVPSHAAQTYAGLLARELPAQNGSPIFDLVMLGMGPDGHTASLFPGSDPCVDDAALVRAPYVEKFGTFRLTLTPRVLTNAREIVVAAAGKEKADAFAAVRDGAADPATYPIAVLGGAAGRLTWFVDSAVTSTMR